VVNDVKYMCEQLLDDAPPPLRDSAEMLARARRATARRSAVRATGGALAVAAVTGVALVAVPAATTVSRTPLVAPPAAASPPPPPVVVPWAQAAGTHDKKMLAAIKKALPAGYVGTSQYPLSTSTTPNPADPSAPLPGGASAMIVTHLTALVSQDGRVGWMSASIVNNGRQRPDKLCSTSANCQVIDVNGVQIEVTREHWDNTAPEIDVIVATRYLRNGQLSIVESRSVPDFQSEKDPLPPDAVNKHPQRQAPTSALGDWFLTEQQLAELVASPAMLP
jgi:hypothetical protein